MNLIVVIATATLLAGLTAASAADKDPQECAGYAPPYKHSCSFPIAVWYKTESGSEPIKSLNLAPGQSGGEKSTGTFRTVVCRQGETAYEWNGGAHGNKPWQGDGYECRK